MFVSLYLYYVFEDLHWDLVTVSSEFEAKRPSAEKKSVWQFEGMWDVQRVFHS